jgi:hypothetical protein
MHDGKRGEMAKGSQKRNSGARIKEGEMPLSWLWHEKDYNIEKKLEEIEHSFHEFYDYGKAEVHAGPIGDSVRKEIDRMHKLFDIDDKIGQIDRGLKEGENG